VVGDPDQTIYTWRGANVDIIMNFTKDYPDTKTVILNENYRSTEAILNGANSVIKNNRHRVKKDLFTNRKSDEKITHYASASDEYQAAWIAEKIAELHRKGKSYTDIAILYRSNYLSRNLEKAMLDMRIPYIIYGGIRFYERQEVKDALCYLRMVTTADDLALGRILNRPKRGIGNKTMDAIAEEARKSRVSMYEVLKRNEIFSGKNKKTIESFVAMVESWREAAANGMEIFRLFEKIIDDSGYRAMLEENKETDRIENIKELIDDVREFSETYPESTLDEYMQLVSLYGDRDETMSSEYVRLMTVHAAKGLEFDTVFVSDMNEGIFPNERAINDSGSRGVEEERRLAYVAFTRARNKLYLTEAGGFSYILQRARTSSRFIREIDPEYIEHIGADSRTGDAVLF
jgi:DNA helicase-2/ATP-dependent DNA helicase PcrA